MSSRSLSLRLWAPPFLKKVLGGLRFFVLEMERAPGSGGGHVTVAVDDVDVVAIVVEGSEEARRAVTWLHQTKNGTEPDAAKKGCSCPGGDIAGWARALLQLPGHAASDTRQRYITPSLIMARVTTHTHTYPPANPHTHTHKPTHGHP